MPSSLLKENVLENLSELPGGMPIVSGPGYAKGADMYVYFSELNVSGMMGQSR